MSEESYQKNVKRGVVGQTCLLASFDRVSNRTGIKPRTYEQYETVRQRFLDVCPEDIEANFVPQDIVDAYVAVTKAFYSELGVHTNRNVVYDRVDTADRLHQRLGKLTIGGFRTCLYLDTGGLHAVGLLPIGDDYYNIRSTRSPFGEEEPVDAGELFEWLDSSPRMRVRENSSRKTLKGTNITGLPAEPRR